MRSLEITHHFTHFQSLGGVQSVLHRHVREDHHFGIQSKTLVYFEPSPSHQASPPSRYSIQGLDLRWFHSIRTLRNRYAAWLRAQPPSEMAVYLNTWGAPLLSDLDQAQRRIGVLHSDWPGIDHSLQPQAKILDGLLCVSQPLLDLARRHWPDFSTDRIAFLPYPVQPPETFSPPSPIRPLSTPLRLGFCGRLEREQKRVERFPPLFQQLQHLQIPFQMEFLGDGPERSWLETHCPPQTRFHGRLSGEAYWNVLSQWDAMVFVSDYEGLPISMLEGFHLGVLPIFPNIGTGGDDYARRVSEALVYPPGNLEQAARSILHLSQLTPEKTVELRTRCQNLVQPHLNDGYMKTFSEFAHRIRDLPRVSRPLEPKRPKYLTDQIPFSLLRRLHYPGLWKSNSKE